MSWRYDMPLITSAAALLLSMSSSHSCDCGAYVHTLHRTNHRYQFGTAQRGTFSRLSSSKNNNEGDYGSPSDDNREDRLAAQFYDQLKKRKLTSASSQDENIISVDDLYTVDSNKNDQRPPVRKFTGASTSSSSLFSNEQTTSPSNNLQREREREYNLAGRFERTFGIQAAILLLSLVGVISVGVSGGITDGSDRNFGYDDMLDIVERFRSDDAAEVEAMHQSSAAVKSVMQIEDSSAGSVQSTTEESYWL